MDNFSESKAELSRFSGNAVAQQKAYDQLPEEVRKFIRNFPTVLCTQDMLVNWLEYKQTLESKFGDTEKEILRLFMNNLNLNGRKQARAEYPAKLWGMPVLMGGENEIKRGKKRYAR